MKFKIFLALLIGVLVLFPQKVHALPLPEITNTIGPIILNMISILVLASTSLFYYLNKKTNIVILVIIIIVVAIAYFICNTIIEKINLSKLAILQNNKTEAVSLNKINPAEETLKKDNYTSYYEKNWMNSKSKALTIEQFRKILEKYDPSSYLLIDIRPKKEKSLYDAAHIKNALFWQDNSEELDKKINSLDKDTMLIFYCDLGLGAHYFANYKGQDHENTYFVNENPIFRLPEFCIGDPFYLGQDCGETFTVQSVKEYLKKGALIADPGRYISDELSVIEPELSQPLKNAVNLPSYDSDLIGKIKHADFSRKGLIIACVDPSSCQEGCYLSKFINISLRGKYGRSFGILPLTKNSQMVNTSKPNPDILTDRNRSMK
jgi:hypothetical protein